METGEIPAANKTHAYGPWIMLDDQSHQRVCIRDASHVETAPHSWDEGILTAEPFYGWAMGYMNYTCTDCGATKSEKIQVLPVMPGDVDRSGTVNTADARLALRAAIGLEHYDAESVWFLAADVDGNKKITTEDARTILRAAIGLETLQ